MSVRVDFTSLFNPTSGLFTDFHPTMVDYSDQYHKIVIFLIIAEPMSISYDQLTLEISHTKAHTVST